MRRSSVYRPLTREIQPGDSVILSPYLEKKDELQVQEMFSEYEIERIKSSYMVADECIDKESWRLVDLRTDDVLVVPIEYLCALSAPLPEEPREINELPDEFYWEETIQWFLPYATFVDLNRYSKSNRTNDAHYNT